MLYEFQIVNVVKEVVLVNVETLVETDLETVRTAEVEEVQDRRTVTEAVDVAVVPVRHENHYVHVDESARCTGMFRHQVIIKLTRNE